MVEREEQPTSASGAEPDLQPHAGPRGSGAGWTAPSTVENPGGPRRWLIAVAATATLAAAGWYGSGAYLENEARQEAADAWDAARTCLLGDGLRAGTAPSERLRRIDLAVRHRRADLPWPARCEAQAARLDRALAARTVRRQLGALPELAPLTTADDPLREAERIDAVFAELEIADLPRARHDPSVPPAPAPARPVLEREQLAPLGRVDRLEDIDVTFDAARGTSLRLLLPEHRPLVCRFNDGPQSERWQSVACRPSPIALPPDAKPLLNLSLPGAPDLIRLRDAGDADGFYDATTGQRLLRARYFDAQAVMRKDGSAHLLYAKLGGEAANERVESFRLMEARPGRRPERHRLRVPKRARVHLEPNRLLWWLREDPEEEGERFAPRDALFTAAIEEPDAGRLLGESERLGALPLGSRLVDTCRSESTWVALFAAGVDERRYTMVLAIDGRLKTPVEVGPLAGAPTLSCEPGAGIVTRHLGRTATRWRCDAERCDPASAGPLPDPEPGMAEIGRVGERMALAWAPDREPLRLRLSEPEGLHRAEDTVVLEDELHGGLEPVALRWLSGPGPAVLLLQDVGRRVYALRVTEGGKVTPVRVAR